MSKEKKNKESRGRKTDRWKGKRDKTRRREKRDKSKETRQKDDENEEIFSETRERVKKRAVE